MPIDSLQTLEVIEAMENFLARKRPPEEYRDKVDLSYKIEDQSIIVVEIRPRFGRAEEKLESSFAKATFVKTKKYWKVFWMRADLKWHSYTPKPTVRSIKEFTDLVEEDKYNCFFG